MPWDFADLPPARKAALIAFIKIRVQNTKIK